MAERDLILRKELESLLNEEKDYLFIKEFRCQTEEDFEKFKRENIFSFERLKYIRNRIREIKWELMTDEEKEQYQQYITDFKEKFKSEKDSKKQTLK